MNKPLTKIRLFRARSAGFTALILLVSTTLFAQSTIWGSSAGAFPGEKIGQVDAWLRLNALVKSANGGIGLQARRSYDRPIPASWKESAMAADTALCKVSIGSMKPGWAATANGTNAEALKNFIRSIPDNRVVYLTFHHEPEDDVRGANTLEVLHKAFAAFVDIVLSSGKKNVHPCFNLMTWTFNPKSGRNPEDFNFAKSLKPGQAAQVIATLDGYADDPTVSARQVFDANIERMKSWGFTRFGVFETGAHSGKTPTARKEWIEGLGAWANSRKDLEVVCWFNNGNGQHAGPKGWFLGTFEKNGESFSSTDGDGTIAAFAQLLKPVKKN